jgi:hypothetical protein
MAASKKVIDNANRLRYIRALERFSKSIVSYLSNNSDVTKERFDKKITNAKKLYDRVEEVVLYKGELQELQKFVKKMIAYKESQESIQKIQDDILYTANQLEKSKNARRYKKEKHSKSQFEEWE